MINCSVRGFSSIYRDHPKKCTPNLSVTLLDSGFIGADSCFVLSSSPSTLVSFTAVSCVFEKCRLGISVFGDDTEFILRESRFHYNNTCIQFSNNSNQNDSTRMTTLQNSQIKREKKETKNKKKKIEILKCEFRVNQHILKAYNFCTKICFKQNKISRTFSKGIILKNCLNIFISNNSFVYNYLKKIYNFLNELPWLRTLITHHAWEGLGNASKDQIKEHISCNPFMVLICSENSNLSLVDNYFLENNGRLILIQQSNEFTNRFSSRLSGRSITKSRVLKNQFDSCKNDSQVNTLKTEFDEICQMRKQSTSLKSGGIIYSFQKKYPSNKSNRKM